MQAEAEPKPRRRRNESACGAPVARFLAWVGPHYAGSTVPSPERFFTPNLADARRSDGRWTGTPAPYFETDGLKSLVSRPGDSAPYVVYSD